MNTSFRPAALCFLVTAVAVQSADASPVFQFDSTAHGQNQSAGRIGSMHSTFDAATQTFAWDVTFSNGVIQNTDGFWLVVSSGPNPKGIQGQLAIIYFDAQSLSNPSVSVYRYNGLNADSSFLDPGDVLASNRGINTYGITASASDSGSARTFGFSITAAGINAKYSSLNGFPNWEGLRFGPKIGVWFHPVANLASSYSGRRLLSFDGTFGAFDASDLDTTTDIPAPASGAVLLGAMVMGPWRRRFARSNPMG